MQGTNEFSDTKRLIPESIIRRMVSKVDDAELTPAVFMVHPVQGTVELLEKLAELIKRPVWGLEFTKEAATESPISVASLYVEAVRSKQAKGPYTIVAYSIGTIFGLEMALKLESEGEQISLICIDGSPEFVKHHIRLTTETQSRVATHETFGWPYVTSMFTNLSFSYLKKETERMPPVRIKKWCCDLLGTDPATLKIAHDLYWSKIFMCENYEPSGKLQTEIKLIKAAENYLPNLSVDYDLSKHCSSVKLWTITNTTHESIMKGKAVEEVAEIINSLL